MTRARLPLRGGRRTPCAADGHRLRGAARDRAGLQCVFCNGRGFRPVQPGSDLADEGWSDLECGACGGAGERTPCVVTAAEVYRVLAAGRYDLTTEMLTHDGMERDLVAAFGREAVSREHRLGPGERLDFLVGGAIAVEVKGPRHRAPAVLRQLGRYACYDQVAAIILATSRAMLMPPELSRGASVHRSIPVRVLNLGRAWL